MSGSLKFSIITPTLNQGKYIKDNIESVLNQNYNNFEHIVVDGLSVDNTYEIIKGYTHLIWKCEKDSGAAEAINKGFKIAKGDIVAWINSDDYYDSNVFESIADIFLNYPEIDFVYGNLTFVNNEKNIIKVDKTVKYNKGFIIHKSADVIRQPCTFIRKRIINKVGLLDEKLKCAFDYEFFIRIFDNSKTFYINRNLAFYRDHEETLTRKYIRNQGYEIIKVARKYGAGFFDKIILANLIKKILFPNFFIRKKII